MQRRALVTGVTGQDGSYLAELLLEQGYEVYGLIRRTSSPNLSRLAQPLTSDKFHLLHGDLTDSTSLEAALETCRPHEIYNLGAQSFVGESWNQPELTTEITGLGTLRLLEALRSVTPYAKFYQASSSEQFGKVQETPQTELTRFYPRSPYGVAKCYAHYITVNYRESYGIHASCGILFNHESPRRGLEFVTRKVTDGVAKITWGLESKLKMGNLEARRDWGHAKDYVRAMHLMLQQERPSDFVIATGETHSIGDLLSIAFREVGANYEHFVELDPSFVRPAEVDLLQGDRSKAEQVLNWVPEISFETMIKEMVREDMARLAPPDQAHKFA